VALFLFFIGLGLVAVNRQNLIDWWRLRNYNAPTIISQLATQDTMTAYARRIFYVNHPDIEGKTAFNGPCPNNGGEQTIVLGCYHSDQAGIYLLNVTDPNLNGVMQVTAAHEMLHAAYDRLSTSERNKVDAMLLDYYNHDLHDPRIIATIAAYKKTEPNNVVNEMHSVFGTEIVNLPSGLEQYYTRYFNNRQQIADFAAQYQAEFTSRQALVAADDSQLATLKNQIDINEADLNSKQTQINMQETQLLAERSSNTAAYNAAVPLFNEQVNSYNASVGSLQGLVNQYNQLVATRNTTALAEDELINDLSASVSTISK
jgi:hypothetical protein